MMVNQICVGINLFPINIVIILQIKPPLWAEEINWILSDFVVILSSISSPEDTDTDPLTYFYTPSTTTPTPPLNNYGGNWYLY